MCWTQVLKLAANETDIEVWKYIASLYYVQQCGSVGVRLLRMTLCVYFTLLGVRTCYIK